MSRQLLNTFKDEDSTTSLGSLYQHSVTLTGKTCFLMLTGSLLCVSLCALPLDLNLDLYCSFLIGSLFCCCSLSWWLNFQAQLE